MNILSMNQKIFILSITNSVLLVLVVIVLIVLWNQKTASQNQGSSQNLPNKFGFSSPNSQIPGSTSSAKTANPNQPSPAKYKEGASGDFKMSLEKKNDGVWVSWDNTVKVSTVGVVQLTNRDLNTQGIVFAIGPIDFTKSPSSQNAQSIKNTFLPNPYQIGTLPQGFYNNNTYSKSLPKPDEVFKKGEQYIITLQSFPDEKTIKVAGYTFTY